MRGSTTALVLPVMFILLHKCVVNRVYLFGEGFQVAEKTDCLFVASLVKGVTAMCVAT